MYKMLDNYSVTNIANQVMNLFTICLTQQQYITLSHYHTSSSSYCRILMSVIGFSKPNVHTGQKSIMRQEHQILMEL